MNAVLQAWSLPDVLEQIARSLRPYYLCRCFLGVTSVCLNVGLAVLKLWTIRGGAWGPDRGDVVVLARHAQQLVPPLVNGAGVAGVAWCVWTVTVHGSFKCTPPSQLPVVDSVVPRV
eukprot:COSAG02_NODE_5888_length_3960_cov_2.066822_5_plen_117_part_00